ncbi:MAG TPA: prepilin-type N-terminal cleavage/methylation domain-containing protein [Dissulfurispiraceae bacterium]|nr:prepilin-type N-terminal cleavage/methylation domain-containing protein [Dissulfurispiraceae bacterium]
MLPFVRKDNGFTLLEVIAVLLIIAIIVAVALIKGSASSTNSISVVSEAATLKAHLRFAQVKALGDVPQTNTLGWGIQVNGSSYQILNNGSPWSLNLPGETSNTHTFAGGVTATPITVTFDRFGNPDLGAANSITLTCGTQTAVINITNTTGFIQ